MDNINKILIIVVIILIGVLGLAGGYILQGYLFNDKSTANQSNISLNNTNNTTQQTTQNSVNPTTQNSNNNGVCPSCGSTNTVIIGSDYNNYYWCCNDCGDLWETRRS